MHPSDAVHATPWAVTAATSSMEATSAARSFTMKLEFPITVLSDLHLGHPASYLTDPAAIAPLLDDTATAIFNGDTVEMLWLCNRDHAQEQIERIAATCLDRGTRPVFLNGNHDPVASSASHLDLCDGTILVTHGDILFPEIAPWSREARLLGPEHSRILQEMGEQAHEDFEVRLVAVKRASLTMEMHEPRAKRGRFVGIATALREGWPPWRALQIVHCWIRTPRLADALAEQFRPQAKFVIIGHTHWSGIWQRQRRTVINTGSFLPYSGRLAVRIQPNALEVHSIVWKKGQWRLGAIIARHELNPDAT